MRFDSWNDELYHHGVKGQKWGLRRYQNPDGTLTAEGKARYYDSSGHLTKHGQKELNRQSKRINNLRLATDIDYQKKQEKKNSAIALLSGAAGVGSGFLGMHYSSKSPMYGKVPKSLTAKIAGSLFVSIGAGTVSEIFAAKAEANRMYSTIQGHNLAVKLGKDAVQHMINSFGKDAHKTGAIGAFNKSKTTKYYGDPNNIIDQKQLADQIRYINSVHNRSAAAAYYYGNSHKRRRE